ncbi:MAG: glycosyltransferase family 39 protein [Candidatus Methanoperedens sp.]|nr:glycosyltransferase family 39 protein [Candidatus Methanoperedens sp.]MCZ7371692.1 glycosyltransferase family 39 protein [Candidatus Methanoperedens sp.]
MKKQLKTKQIVKNSFDWLIPIIFLISLINSLRAAFSQYYLIGYADDIALTLWGKVHGISISILIDQTGTGYRPIRNLMFAIGYTLWGSNTFMYYLLNGILFAGAMIFLYLIVKMFSNKFGGVCAVLLYIFLDASFILVWKINFVVTLSELFFMMASLYYSFRFYESHNRNHLLLSFVIGILAFMSKEPSIIIIPIVNLLYLISKSEHVNKPHRNIIIGFYILIPFIFLVIMLVKAPEVGGHPTIDMFKEKLFFYIDQEATWQLKNIYLFGFVLLFSLIKIKDVRYQIGLIWVAIGITLNSLSTQIVQPTYLAEANLGFVFLFGIIISSIRAEHKLVQIIFAAIIILQLVAIPQEIANTNNYQENAASSQTVVKEIVVYLKSNMKENATIFYIPSDVRSKYGEQIDAIYFQDLLCLENRCDINVKLLSNNTNNGYIVLISNLDVYVFVNEYKEIISRKISSQKEFKIGQNVGYVLQI